MNMPLIAAALLLTATNVIAQPTKTVDRTIPLAPSGSVTLETHNGSIDVQTWDRPNIQIHARIEAAGTSGDDVRRLEQTSVDIQAAADSVRITSKYPTFSSWSWWFGSNPRIDYTITAPKTARWRISDHNATVDVRGVHAPVTIEAHNGRVHLSDVEGPLRIDAHNGSVTADLVSFKGAEFTSHLGSVELTMPATSAFDLHADTRRGGVQSDFPLTVRALGRRQTAVEGAINGGGPSLRFISHRGELRLRRKT
jgi:DUF4097 and DUF4098 domain-containing protein YvlB